MKHIKLFEELNPSTYLSAGEKLIKKGFSKRGEKLIQYALGMNPETPIKYIGVNNKTIETTLGNISIKDYAGYITIYDDKIMDDRHNPRSDKEWIIEIPKDPNKNFFRSYINDRSVANILSRIINKYFEIKGIDRRVSVNDILRENVWSRGGYQY